MEELSKALYGWKSFQRVLWLKELSKPCMARKLLRVFFGQISFYGSYVAICVFLGLMYLGELLQNFYGWKTFPTCSMAGRLLIHILWPKDP